MFAPSNSVPSQRYPPVLGGSEPLSLFKLLLSATFYQSKARPFALHWNIERSLYDQDFEKKLVHVGSIFTTTCVEKYILNTGMLLHLLFITQL